MLSDRQILSLGATSMGHFDPTQESQAASEEKLKAYACELEQKLEARTRELADRRPAGVRHDCRERSEVVRWPVLLCGAVRRRSPALC